MSIEQAAMAISLRAQVEHDEMTIHRYPASSLLGDGLRAGLGLTATLGPLLFLDVVSLMWPILGGLGMVFVFFACQVFLQSLSTIELSDQRIVIRGPNTKVLEWCDLSMLKLSYYGPTRRGGKGWYRLSLSGEGSVLKLESTIEGFDSIASMARKAAESLELALDPTTSDNLDALLQKVDD